MTMRELAQLANVSVSTVSKAFRDAEDVSKETKEHVFSIARELGCYGKFYKGKYSKKIIAIICPELVSDYFIGYVERLQSIIEKNNGIALVSTDHFDVLKQAELVEYYASFLRVDGIFIIGLKFPLKKGYEIPIVSLFPYIDSNVDSVRVDIYTPIVEALNKLKNSGHSKIAFLGERLTERKAKHFQDAVDSIGGIESKIIVSELRFEKAGKDCINKLLETNKDYTAVVCAYDNIAIGAIKQLKKRGYSVPQDYSVIGIDNINISEYIETSLTTIDTVPDEICMIAWDLLCKKLKNKFYKSYQRIVVTGRLIDRESVSKARDVSK